MCPEEKAFSVPPTTVCALLFIDRFNLCVCVHRDLVFLRLCKTSLHGTTRISTIKLCMNRSVFFIQQSDLPRRRSSGKHACSFLSMFRSCISQNVQKITALLVVLFQKQPPPPPPPEPAKVQVASAVSKHFIWHNVCCVYLYLRMSFS